MSICQAPYGHMHVGGPCDQPGHVISQRLQLCRNPLEQCCAGEKELHATVTDVDPKDAVTPDNWVPRHRDLIRCVCCTSMRFLWRLCHA